MDDEAVTEGIEIRDYCRHCGVKGAVVAPDGDWLCTACERYQDATACPTCGSTVRISLLPEELAPKPAKPVK